VLVHELGHHATGATWPILVGMWLAAPWRAAARLLTGLGNASSGRRSRRGLGIAGAFGAVAVVQAVHQGHWLAGGVVAAVTLCALTDALVRRRAEFAADRCAADRGLSLELAARAPRNPRPIRCYRRMVAAAVGSTPAYRSADQGASDRAPPTGEGPWSASVVAATAQELPSAGEWIQQPVQQPGLNDGVPRRTAADAAWLNQRKSDPGER
jgi:STE24 endopeptidase